MAGTAPPVPAKCDLFLLGLTGSIGMGKSTVSAMLADLGVPVLDADAVVHALYARGGSAVGPVGAAFPGTVVDGAVDRAALSKLVVGDEAAIKRLESIVHPLVTAERGEWLRSHAASARGSPVLLVLDIPLLYETGAQADVDAVAVVSAGPDAQRQRVLARPGMVASKFEAILARQVPDANKRALSDYVIDTSTSLDETQREVEALVEKLRGRRGTAAAAVLAGPG